MTPDRSFAPDVMAMNLVPYMRSLQDKDVTFTVTYRLTSVERDGNRLKGDHRQRLHATGQDPPFRPDRHQSRYIAAR
jgi:hypothetical protein